ncbi:MAG: hypothetical protein R2880_13465 [Deinococcales bacterium]
MSIMFFNNQLQAGMAALERVSSLLDDEEEKGGKLKIIPHAGIIFKDVVFNYPLSERAALNGLNLDIADGSVHALVGPFWFR